MTDHAELVSRLREWGETPYEGDPMIDALLSDVPAAADAIETLQAKRDALLKRARSAEGRLREQSALMKKHRAAWNEDRTVYKAQAARIAELEAERDMQKSHGDNHWETLRSIRQIAREGDCERIIRWVTDAGSGYTDTAENTMSQLQDRNAELEAGLRTIRDKQDGCYRAADCRAVASALLDRSPS